MTRSNPKLILKRTEGSCPFRKNWDRGSTSECHLSNVLINTSQVYCKKGEGLEHRQTVHDEFLKLIEHTVFTQK